MLSEQQINFNLNAVDNAIAQQTLEGLTVSEDVIINQDMWLAKREKKLPVPLSWITK